MHADLVLRGGHAYLVDAARSWAQAVAVADGRIVAAGTDAQVSELIGPRTEVVDLAGRMVLPGFQDAHVHASGGGLERIQLRPVRPAQPRRLPGRGARLRGPQSGRRLDHRRRLVDGCVPGRDAQPG